MLYFSQSDKYLLSNFFTAEGLFCTPPGARRINWQRGWRRRALSRNGIHIFINKTKRKRNGTTYYNKYLWLSKNRFLHSQHYGQMQSGQSIGFLLMLYSSICRPFLDMKITGFSDCITENNFFRLDIILVWILGQFSTTIVPYRNWDGYDIDCLRHNHETWMVMTLTVFGITTKLGWLCRWLSSA